MAHHWCRFDWSFTRNATYIMTVCYLFSKWPEATALPDKTAIGVSEFLFHCFTRHGCCKIQITDQGQEFVNKVLNKQQMYVYMKLFSKVNDELCRFTGVQ